MPQPDQQPGFDLSENLRTTAEQRVAERQARQGQKQQTQQAEDEWNNLWSHAISEFTTQGFLKLGRMIASRDGGIWLDYLKVRRQRELYIAHIKRQQQEWLKNSAASIWGLRLLFAVTRQQEDQSDRLINEVSQTPVITELRSDFERSLWEVKGWLESWIQQTTIPVTPPMSRNELAICCQKNLKRFSGSSIHRSLESGELLTQEQFNFPKRLTWYLFRHKDQNVHERMVRRATEWLLSQRNQIIPDFSVPPIFPDWEA